MTQLTRWEPFRDLVSLREAMDRLFEESFVRPRGAALAPRVRGTLAVDMYETDEDVVVKVSVPGIDPEDLDISITGDTLTIRGESRAEEEVEEDNYIYRERRYGAFSRTVTVPMSVEADKAEAEFEDGVLTLRLPKTEEVKPKAIKVKAK
ncbi:MAG: Hsp20/alpha crystallin family protein [Chloroflexota bacterium]|nr:Hsp20/alpha crystallin family protein [Chloroflexota bacterium]